MQPSRTLTAFLLAGIAAVTITACGDDGDIAEEATTTTGTEEDVNPCSPDAPPEETALEGESPTAGATIHDIRAVEYRFEDVPETLAAGQHGFRLIGAGEEFHELALVRVEDDRLIEELLDLPESEQETAIPYLGGVTACPGTTSEALGAELEPGRYALLCFVPVGTTPDLRSDYLLAAYENAPHFTEGMLAEITVE